MECLSDGCVWDILTNLPGSICQAIWILHPQRTTWWMIIHIIFLKKKKKRKGKKIVNCNRNTNKTKIILQSYIKEKNWKVRRRNGFSSFSFLSVTWIMISTWPFSIRCLNGSCYYYSIPFDQKLLRTVVCFAKVIFFIYLWLCSKGLPTKYTRFSLRINYITAFKLNISQEIYGEYYKRILKIHLTVCKEYPPNTS